MMKRSDSLQFSARWRICPLCLYQRMSPVTEVRDITLPVAVLLPCWSAPLSPRSHSVKAQRSRDISESGTFVHAAACPPLGASVRLRISLEAAAGATETL